MLKYIIFFGLCIVLVSSVLADSQTKYTSNWYNLYDGLYSWDIYGQPNADGYVDTLGGDNAGTLLGDTWGFTIPNDATINGIEVDAYRWCPNGCGDGIMQLFNGDGLIGDNYANMETSGGWTSYGDWASYGGNYDNWGLALTPTMINDPTFGLGIQTWSWGDYMSTTHYDSVSITVYYTSNAPSDSCTYSGSGNWTIQLKDDCNISKAVSVGSNNIIFNGSGYATFGNDSLSPLTISANKFVWQSSGNAYLWFKTSTWFNGSME